MDNESQIHEGDASGVEHEAGATAAVQTPGPDGGESPATIPPMFERAPIPTPEQIDAEASGLLDSDEEEAPRDSLSQFISTMHSDEPRFNPEDEDSLLPRQPRTLVDLGLSKAFLTDLTLKIIHYSGTPTVVQLTRRLGLGPTIVQHLVTALSEEHLIEVLSQSDLYTGNYRYRLSSRGNQRVNEALDRSRYAGPAPVTAEQYNEVLRKAQAQPQDMGRARIKSLLNEMVLTGETVDSVARALYSGKAALLFGPSGNGKSSILERFAADLDGFTLVPYSIYAYGQVIRVFDQSIHQPIENLDGATTIADESKFDRRWVVVKRPSVILGAEMGQESLDLAYDPHARFYQAPPHVKVQGGLIVVDDFGRQKVEARDLLTRWLIPLERGWDTLTLATGEKMTIPFNVQILFGTNLRIRSLADDALLRRILYKVEVPAPQQQEFMEILRKMCHQKQILVADGALEHAVEKLYNEPTLKLRASYARDLLDMIVESASFDDRDPILDSESFDRVFKLLVAQEHDPDSDEGF
jgi:hypothetical protein